MATSEDTTCPTCGRDDFKNAQGLKIHRGQVHDERNRPTVVCEECNSDFTVEPYRVGEVKYCSRECKGNAMSKVTGPDHPSWKGGKRTLSCEQCGDEFEVDLHRADEAKYCSPQCVGEATTESGATNPAWKGGRVALSCEQCGGEFEVDPHRADEAKYCSRRCKDNAMVGVAGPNHPLWKPSVEVACETCGNGFEVGPGRENAARFCSRECYGKHRTSHIFGEAHPQWKGRVEITCRECGEGFRVKPSRADAARFCSRECQGKHRASHICGEAHPQWEGGYFPYGPGWTPQKKRTVRRRDQFRCQDCGVTQPEHIKKHGRKLDVHHIVPARQFDDPEKRNAVGNLVTLCRACHAKWERMSGLRPDTREQPAD